MSETSDVRVAVIGAGASGLASLRALDRAGLDPVAFEARDQLGGNWAFGARAAAYRSLHANTSRTRLGFREVPTPEDWPDYPHHELVAAYLSDYGARFDLTRRIRCGTEVARVTPDAAGRWRLSFRDGTSVTADWVVLATGHHRDPHWPEPWPGRFDGPILHGHDYVDPRTPVDLVGRRVVVVGLGNSAVDIACELGLRSNAARVFLSARKGGWIVPKYLFGRPTDLAPEASGLPRRLRNWMARQVLRATVGLPTDLGLPEPDHGPIDRPAVLSSDLPVRIGHGDVVPKPAIAALLGGRVRFADGSEEAVDAILCCTGYKVTVPVLDPALLPGADGSRPLGLYRHVFSADLPGLAFVGFVQPLGAPLPVAEAQAAWVADVISGAASLPDRATMRAGCGRGTGRGGIMVDPERYAAELARERAPAPAPEAPSHLAA